LASLESQRRRVPDCELVFLARILDIELGDLFPRNLPLSRIGPEFRSNRRAAIFPTRAEK